MQESAQTAYDFSADASKVFMEVLIKALPIALLYCLLLAVVSLVLIVVMHRRRLYTREARIWNVLSKMHYLLWLFIFGSLGFALGMIASFQSTADRAIDEKLKPVLVELALPLKQMIISSLPPELADKPMTGQEIYDYIVEKASYQSMLEDKAGKDDGLFITIGRKFENGVRQHMTKVAIDMAIVEAGARVGLSEGQAEFSLEAFKKIDFAAKAEDIAGQVTGLVKQQVGGFANGLRLQCALCAGILVLLLFVEPLVYYKLVLPRKAKALAVAAVAEESLGPPTS